ncbi:myoD family inhibitor [Astyanax mexicanus]|uniref:MyoD family inhibitor-like n=2 Tax=Astyanax mexicanus TaxID=7994 RepID=A0A8B9RAP1_ASTMX|nr:myoD family inhibitor [Astyanax mexicanus]KAG9260517.1 myoD family inhibitor-like [Astyanax mexicanus]
MWEEEEHSPSASLPEPPDGACPAPETLPEEPSAAPSSGGDGSSHTPAQELPPQPTPSVPPTPTMPPTPPTSPTPPNTEKPSNPENGNNNNSLSQPDFCKTPSKSITCQPQARSTPLPSSLSSSSEAAALLRNGSKPITHQAHSNGVKNGAPLLRAVSSSSSTSTAPHKNTKKLQSNPSINSQSSKRSKGSSKSNSSQIPTEAQDDCCVHCILACLFCEFLTLCNIVLDCATCGSCASDDSCFCCCCASEECGDCDLPCDMDCGIIDACCESADCLEICMECCGLCFSS